MNTCGQCQKDFSIQPQEKAFYKRIDVPEPILCPSCRYQHMLVFRNERNLYYRKCDFTGENMLSIYPQETPYTVYNQKVWWSNQWDALTFGQDVDFGKPFFEQFAELMKKVPRRNLISYQSENSDYTNVCSYSKDCYLLFSSDYNQSCYFVSYLQKCINCVDCFLGSSSELCYECVNFHKSYNCIFGTDIESCVDCFFCLDCKGCQNVAFSCGLRNKQYCIWNKQYSRNEYLSILASLNLGSFQGLNDARMQSHDFLSRNPRPPAHMINTENCSGDYIMNSKNCSSCFNLQDSQDCQYLYDGIKCKDCFDCAEIGFAELSYQVLEGVPNTYSVHFSTMTSDSSFLDYCDHCYNSKNLFGCIGMKKNEYCILNKQYSKDGYDEMRKRLIEHMKKTGEWGQFFPVSLSPFAYNETTANEHFPLSKNEAEAIGYRWKDSDLKEFENQKLALPDDIKDTPDSILGQKFSCKECGRNYHIIVQELKFYKNMRLPVPRLCPDCRHKKRLSVKNPRKIIDRTCQKCGIPIQTTYDPSRTETVYCEKCYLQEIY